MPPKLRVGVIGLGNIAKEHHLPHWKSFPHAEIVALCDTNPERLAEIGANFPNADKHENWQELVSRSDLDVVDIAAPNELHGPIAIMALDLEKHVLCEKPMATSAVDAERMLQVSRERDRRLMINHHFRFHPIFEALKASSDALGKPYHAHCRWHRRRRVPTSPTFLQSSLSGGGPILDLGVHVVDLAMALMGFPKPTSVSGTVGTHLGRQVGLGGDWGDWEPESFQVEDFGCGLFRFANGATLFLETSWLGFHETEEEWFVRVLGTEAGLHWPDGLIVREKNKVPTTTKINREVDSSTPYRQSIHRFADAILYHKPVPILPEESLTVVRMMEAIYVSARSKREVPIAP